MRSSAFSAISHAGRLVVQGRGSAERPARAGDRGGAGRIVGRYHLARLGHSVEIHEAASMAGGMMQFGIPAYRLPREDLKREIRRIEAAGVKIVLNHKVEDVLTEIAAGRFDAAFLAIGADVGKHVEIPARDAVRVLDAVALLHDVGASEPPLLGRRVVVYAAAIRPWMRREQRGVWAPTRP